jgi:hypothetical protein
MKKTMLWKGLCESDTLEMFVNMSEYLEKMITHLKKLNLMFSLISPILRAILRISFQN